MAYVPGYRHDLFVSYAHGDDRAWVARFVDRLEVTLTQRLGFKPSVWIDETDLRASRDFSREIPDSLRTSAVFLFLASPTYIRSDYCVNEECRTFRASIERRHLELGADFANDLFALRCLLLPVDDNEHWSLFRGLTDIVFCDESGTMAIGSADFEVAFRRVVGEAVGLLKRMRNRSTAVFVYPRTPTGDVREAHAMLVAELSDNSFRILPDRNVNLDEQLRGAALSVFLLGAEYDEGAKPLTDIAHETGKPWVVWSSPAAEERPTPKQSGLCLLLEQRESARKTYLNADKPPGKLKEEILGLLRPDPRALPEGNGKPRVYLVYNARDRTDMRNAGLISIHFDKDVHFELPNDPTMHAKRLSGCDGVLLVWGNTDEAWCAQEFAEMVQSPRERPARHGLCLFDPSESKASAVSELRKGFADLFISEQFGRFDPARLTTFFEPLLRRPPGGGRP